MKKIFRKILVKLYAIAKHAHQQEKYDAYRSRFAISKSFRFNGSDIQIYGDGKFRAGDNSYVGSYSTIQLAKDCEVVIGDYCRISHNVRMYTSSAQPDQDFKNHNALESKVGSIRIGNAVWIGVNVFIGPGIEIGDNAIIGANSVVTQNIPENAIAGGVPAKIMRFKKQDA